MSVGILLGTTSSDAHISFLTEKTQDQFFEIQDLKMELQRCEHNAGVIDEIVLPVYVRG